MEYRFTFKSKEMNDELEEGYIIVSRTLQYRPPEEIPEGIRRRMDIFLGKFCSRTGNVLISDELIPKGTTMEIILTD